MFVHERISALLARNGLTQKNLADSTGIAASAISDWKKKNTNPSADAIVRISEYLGVSTDYLLTGKQNQLNDTADRNLRLLVDNYLKLDRKGKEAVQIAAFKELLRVEDGWTGPTKKQPKDTRSQAELDTEPISPNQEKGRSSNSPDVGTNDSETA